MNMGIIRNPHTGGEYHIRTFDHGTCHNIYPVPTLEQTLSLACLHSSHLRGSGFWWQRQHRLHGVPGSHLGQKAPRVLVVDRGPMHDWTFWSVLRNWSQGMNRINEKNSFAAGCTSRRMFVGLPSECLTGTECLDKMLEDRARDYSKICLSVHSSVIKASNNLNGNE